MRVLTARRGPGLALGGVAAAGAVLLGTFAPAAQATQGVSQLLVSQTTTLTDGVITTAVQLDLSGVNTATVYVGLDSSCPNVFVSPSGHGQKYGITTSFNPSGVAAVNPTSASGLICSSVTSFAISGVSVGSTTLSFYPQAKAQGLQNKLSNTPATVTVTVIDSGSGGGCQVNCNPGPSANPAAPAVANMIFDEPDANAVQACQNTFPGKNWRGKSISGVADVMAKPESIKDTMSYSDWLTTVYGYLMQVCGTFTPSPPV